jgi:hypothetical protein
MKVCTFHNCDVQSLDSRADKSHRREIHQPVLKLKGFTSSWIRRRDGQFLCGIDECKFRGLTSSMRTHIFRHHRNDTSGENEPNKSPTDDHAMPDLLMDNNEIDLLELDDDLVDTSMHDQDYTAGEALDEDRDHDPLPDPMDEYEVPMTHRSQDLYTPPALLASQLGIDPTTKVVVCQACKCGLQRKIIQGHFIENHGGLSSLPNDLGAQLDALGVPDEIGRPLEIVAPIQGIPTARGWYCRKCKYAALAFKTVVNHVSSCCPGIPAKENISLGRVQVVFHSPTQTWTVEPGYSTAPFVDHAQLRRMVEDTTDGYENPPVPVTFAIPENRKAVSQYLKELGWLEEIQGYNPREVSHLASLPTKDEPDLAMLKPAIYSYMGRMRTSVVGMETVVRRWVQTPSG